ncbi:MAG: hypothetical protein MZV63_46305 [Marinilabiliales bacterium]|nr:hypothetical protein [Marinilabiliales bacterium]
MPSMKDYKKAEDHFKKAQTLGENTNYNHGRPDDPEGRLPESQHAHLPMRPAPTTSASHSWYPVTRLLLRPR